MNSTAAHAGAEDVEYATTVPIRVAVAPDCELVLAGLSAMLAPFADRVTVLAPHVDARADGGPRVDIALSEVYLGPPDPSADVIRLRREWRVARVVVYSWKFTPVKADGFRSKGASGWLSMALSAEEIVEALEEALDPDTLVTRGPVAARNATRLPAGGWPGEAEGLTERESEIVGHIAQGLSNQEVAERAYLSINTVKSYIRASYRKMGVTGRSTAVLWAVDHGFRDHRPPRSSRFHPS